MPTDKPDPETPEKKEPKRRLRDLSPKKDIKGGAQQPGARSEKRSPGSTGEIDFMNWD